MNDLIKAIEDLPEASYSTTGTVYTQSVIDLINTHMTGKVIVPVEPTGWMIHEGLANFNPGQSPTGSMYDAYKAMVSTTGDKS